jgi:hypothetical protein
VERVERNQTLRKTRDQMRENLHKMLVVKKSGSLDNTGARLLALAITHTEDALYRLNELLGDG